MLIDETVADKKDYLITCLMWCSKVARLGSPERLQN